jgi:hypothetical protein
MCNQIHGNSKAPKKMAGFGYKIFRMDGRSVVTSVKYMRNNKTIRAGGWVTWDPAAGLNSGFCAIKNKKTAIRAARNWGGYPWRENYFISKIEFKEALAEHTEYGFVDFGITILLVRKFRRVVE